MSETLRREWTLLTPTQQNKATTVNDRIQDIENALDDLLSVDLTASNVTLTEEQWSDSAGFYLTGTSTAGRSVTVPAQEGPRDFFLDASWTHTVSIVRGSTTLTLTPGNGIRVFAKGDTNGLYTIARGAATADTIAGLTDGPGALGTAGQYLRMNSGATAWEWATRRKPISIGFEAALADGEVFARYVAEEAFTIPASLTGTVGHCATPDGGSSTVLTLKKNGSSFGSITIGTGGSITLSAASPTSFAIGDRLTAEGPGTATTAAEFAATILGSIP